jgi:hypothetical protein
VIRPRSSNPMRLIVTNLAIHMVSPSQGVYLS